MMTDALVFNRLLVPIDGSPPSRRAVAHAARVAAQVGGGLSIVHAPMHYRVTEPAPEGQWLAGVGAMLRSWDTLPDEIDQSFETLPDIDVPKAVARIVARDGIDLIVAYTSARQGFQRWMDGSIAEAIGRRSGIPTLYLPSNAPDLIDLATGECVLKRVLVPARTEADLLVAHQAMDRLLTGLGRMHAEAVLLHVGSEETMPEPKALVDDPRWSLKSVAQEGGIVEAIVETAAAEDVDLVVMATHGHDSMVDRIGGNRTEQVLRRVGRAVMAAPHPPRG